MCTTAQRGAKPLRDIGIDSEVHGGEPYHRVVITPRYGDGPGMTPWCTSPRHYVTTGTSDVKVADEGVVTAGG